MTHQDIDQQELVEGYVRNKLTPERRLAFEEHFFACDECFDKVQTAERFVAGVRYAAEAGLLAREIPGAGAAKPLASLAGWLRPALALSAAAALALAIVLAWLLFYRTPQLQSELARERNERARELQEDQDRLDRASEELKSEIGRSIELQRQLAELQAGNQSGRAQPEANTPVVMLQAERGAGAPIPVRIPAGVSSFVLMNEPGPSSRFGSYGVEVDSASHKRVLAVDGLKNNADGMLSVSLPAQLFTNGTYSVSIYGVNHGHAELSSRYRINIRKP